MRQLLDRCFGNNANDLFKALTSDEFSEVMSNYSCSFFWIKYYKTNIQILQDFEKFQAPLLAIVNGLKKYDPTKSTYFDNIEDQSMKQRLENYEYNLLNYLKDDYFVEITSNIILDERHRNMINDIHRLIRISNECLYGAENSVKKQLNNIVPFFATHDIDTRDSFMSSLLSSSKCTLSQYIDAISYLSKHAGKYVLHYMSDGKKYQNYVTFHQITNTESNPIIPCNTVLFRLQKTKHQTDKINSFDKYQQIKLKKMMHFFANYSWFYRQLFASDYFWSDAGVKHFVNTDDGECFEHLFDNRVTVGSFMNAIKTYDPAQYDTMMEDLKEYHSNTNNDKSNIYTKYNNYKLETVKHLLENYKYQNMVKKIFINCYFGFNLTSITNIKYEKYYRYRNSPNKIISLLIKHNVTISQFLKSIDSIDKTFISDFIYDINHTNLN